MGKPYTIANMRPRRTVSLYGRTLAPKGRGRTSCLDLSEEDLLGPPCVRLLQLKRIALTRGVMPASLSAILFPPEEEEEAVVEEEELSGPPEGTDPRIAHLWADGKTPTAEMVDEALAAFEEPEPALVIEEPPSEPEPSPEVTPEPVMEVPPSGPSLHDVAYQWSEDELFALNTSDQKIVLRGRGLKVGGKESDRVQRILEMQALSAEKES